MHNFRHIHQTFHPQLDSDDCGQAALLSLLRYYGFKIDYKDLLTELPPGKGGVSLLDLKRTAGTAGLKATCLQAGTDDLDLLEGPAILHVSNELRSHFIVSYRRCLQHGVTRYLIGDPSGYVSFFDRKTLEAYWQVNAVLVIKEGNVANTNCRKITSLRDLLKLHGRLPVLVTASALSLFLTLPVYGAFMAGARFFVPGGDNVAAIFILAGLGALARSVLTWIGDALTFKSEERIQEALTDGIYPTQHGTVIPGLADEPDRLKAAFRSLTATVFPDLILLFLFILFLGHSNWYLPAMISVYVMGIMIFRWHTRYSLIYRERQLADLTYMAEMGSAINDNVEGHALYKRRTAVLARRRRSSGEIERRNQTVINLIGISMLLAVIPMPEVHFGCLSKVSFLFIIYMLINRIFTELPKFFQGVIALEDHHRRKLALAGRDRKQAPLPAANCRS